MPIQLNKENSGKVLTIYVGGMLVKEEYEHFVSEFDGLIRQKVKPRVLIDLTGFEGWEGGGIQFDVNHFSNVERLAVVGKHKWQQGIVMSYQPFIKTTIQYFDYANSAEAWKWLGGVILRTN